MNEQLINVANSAKKYARERVKELNIKKHDDLPEGNLKDLINNINKLDHIWKEIS